MHEMDQTNKILTIIGLVLDGLGVFSYIMGAVMMLFIFTEEFFLRIDPNIPIEEISYILSLYQMFGIMMVVMAVIKIIFVVVNITLFVRLIKGVYDEQKAVQVYTYMFIYGIINVFMNTISGILFIIAGYQGKSGHREVRQVREGI